MLTLADLKFAVFEAGSLRPYTWKATRDEAERVALERSQWTGKPHLVESDGSIYCGNICLIIGSRTFDHFRPLNSREPWPLWLRLRNEPDAEEFRAFDDEGNLSDEMKALLQ